MTFFSDRELGPRPRTSEQINSKVWGGIYSAIQKRIDDGSFGYGFPEQCPDGYGISGCDVQKLRLTVEAEIPNLEWPLTPERVPSFTRYLIYWNYSIEMLEILVSGTFTHISATRTSISIWKKVRDSSEKKSTVYLV